LHGSCLKIIGFWVDANRGLISLSPESVDDIIQRVDGCYSTINWGSVCQQPPLG
jgi:hypothetical protein